MSSLSDPSEFREDTVASGGLRKSESEWILYECFFSESVPLFLCLLSYL